MRPSASKAQPKSRTATTTSGSKAKPQSTVTATTSTKAAPTGLEQTQCIASLFDPYAPHVRKADLKDYLYANDPNLKIHNRITLQELKDLAAIRCQQSSSSNPRGRSANSRPTATNRSRSRSTSRPANEHERSHSTSRQAHVTFAPGTKTSSPPSQSRSQVPDLKGKDTKRNPASTLRSPNVGPRLTNQASSCNLPAGQSHGDGSDSDDLTELSSEEEPPAKNISTKEPTQGGMKSSTEARRADTNSASLHSVQEVFLAKRNQRHEMIGSTNRGNGSIRSRHRSRIIITSDTDECEFEQDQFEESSSSFKERECLASYQPKAKKTSPGNS